MGIRIKKVIGYGLTNVKHDGYKLDDPRINADSPFFLRDGTLTLAGYINFLEGKTGDDGRHNRDYGMEYYWLKNDDNRQRRGHRDPEGCVHWQPEYGLPNVLLLRPVANDDWSRYDDTIDWIEETYLRSEKHAQQPWARKFQHGIYPYSGSYMDSRDGRRLDDTVMVWIRLRSDGKPGAERDEALDGLAEILGFKDHKQANRYIAPIVPGEIRALAEYGELFTDDKVLLQLRPLIYCYWS